MKPCLKQSSRPPSPTADHPVKHVAFGADGSDEVFFADEWDRTPAAPARNLSYQDILELKEIQRSLPRAIQPADLIGSRPASHYLSTVPIGLLPLLPESDNTPPAPSSPVASALTFSQSSWRTVRTPAPSIPHPQIQSSAWHPPHLSHLPAARPPIQRPRGRFAFLPLLDSNNPDANTGGESRSRTPSPSPASPPPSERSTYPDFDVSHDHDPPTPSLTNASVDSSPLSCASSCSPEPTFLQLPPSCAHGRFCGGQGGLMKTTNASTSSMPQTYVDDQLASSDSWSRSGGSTTSGGDGVVAGPHDYRRPVFGAFISPISPALTFTTSISSSSSSSSSSASSSCSSPTTSVPPSPPSTPTKKPKKEKKKNVIVINDIEIELDDDDQGQDQDRDQLEEDAEKTPANDSLPAKTSVPDSIPNANVNITAPTPTRPFTPLPPPQASSSTPMPAPSPAPTSPLSAYASHSPICFKRGMNNATTTTMTARRNSSCSPPRALVPSA